MLCYCDWNILNKIEKTGELKSPEKEVYLSIEKLILDKKILVPYSNAHISDLNRGYLNNPAYIEGHLNTLLRLTLNLCNVQYWGESKARWHYREPKEFFDSTLQERYDTPDSFIKLFNYFEDDPLIMGVDMVHGNIAKLVVSS